MREGGGQADGAAVRGGGGPELLLLVKAGQMDGTRACCDGRRLERRTGRGRAAMEGGVGHLGVRPTKISLDILRYPEIS